MQGPPLPLTFIYLVEGSIGSTLALDRILPLADWLDVFSVDSGTLCPVATDLGNHGEPESLLGTKHRGAFFMGADPASAGSRSKRPGSLSLFQDQGLASEVQGALSPAAYTWPWKFPFRIGGFRP